MKNLGKRFDDLMAAASFAEEGEPDTARELLKARKKVLLVLTGKETDNKSLRYALNIAKRTDADLEVLAADSEAAGTALQLCEEEAGRERIGFESFRKGGCIRDATVSHAGKRRDLVCVVIESTDALEVDCSPKGGRKLSGIWKKLGCPLTLVSEKCEETT